MVIQTDLECLLLQSCNNTLAFTWVLSCSVMSDSLQPHGLQLASLLCPWISQARIPEWVIQSGLPFSSPGDLSSSEIEPTSPALAGRFYIHGLPFPSSGDLPNPGLEPGFPALQADALPSEPPGKPSLYTSLYNYEYLF